MYNDGVWLDYAAWHDLNVNNHPTWANLTGNISSLKVGTRVAPDADLTVSPAS